MAGTWSSGGNLNTGRQLLGGAGSQTAGLSFGGDAEGETAVTEEYDGSAWSSGGALNTARSGLGGAGTQTAGLSFGGVIGISNSAVTEEYDGSAWSSGGALNTARRYLGGAGTQTAGISFGGYDTSYSAVTEEYDGSAWSSGGNLSTARMGIGGCGMQNAGLSFGGRDSSYNYYNTTEEYNGSAWSSGGDLNTTRGFLAGAGTQTAGLSFGGYDDFNFLTTTEEYLKAQQYSWTGSLIQYHSIKHIAENNNYAYLSFYQKASTDSKLTLKSDLKDTQYQTLNLSSVISFISSLQLTEYQTPVTDLKYILKTLELIQNQSILSIILPTYNLLNRDIDNFHIIQSLDRPINYAECKLQGDINIDLFEPIKMQARSPVNNSMQIMFLGLITDYEQSLNEEITIINIKAKDYSFLLENQYINESYANTSSSLNPSDYIITMLGGDDWLATTGIYPYNISDVPNWSQDHQFIWDPIRTTKLKAIHDIEKWSSMKFFLDYANVSNIPRPRAYFVHATSTSEVLDHFSIDMDNDSTITEITKHQTIDGFKNTIKVFGYNTSMIKLTSTRLYSNRSFPLEKTYESIFLNNQSMVNERANTLYDAYIYGKEKYTAVGVLRPEIRAGTTITVNNLSGHSNETFTIYHVEHDFQIGLGNTKFKYAKIPNTAYIDANKDATIADIIKNTAQRVIDNNHLTPFIATVSADEGGGLYTIRLENSSTEVKSVNILSNVSIGDRVLYFKNNNVAIK